MRLSRRSLLCSGLAAAFAPTHGFAGPDALDAGAFGVKPDQSDATAKLQALLIRAAREQRSVFLPPGRYGVQALALPERVRLYGVPGASVLVAARDDAPVMTGRGMTLAQFGELVLEGRKGATGSGALIQIAQSDAVSFRSVGFRHAPARALELTGVAGRVEHCRFEQIGTVALFSLDARGLIVTDCTIAGCGDNGIQIWRSARGRDGTMLSRNRISDIRARAGGSGQNGNGINIFRAGEVLVEGNHVADCAFTAIRANQGSNVRMIANHAARCGEVALYAEFGFEGAVISGNVVEDAMQGINITNFDHGGRLAVCHGNIIRRMKHGLMPQKEIGGGSGIHAEADTVVSGNVIEDAERIAISLGWGEFSRNLVASGNVIRNAEYGIAVSVAPKTGATLVTGNLVAGARKAAIVARAWDKMLSGDLMTESAAKFPQISLSGNRAG